MPMSSSITGKKYTPTPITEHLAQLDTIPEPVSPPPSRFEQKSALINKEKSTVITSTASATTKPITTTSATTTKASKIKDVSSKTIWSTPKKVIVIVVIVVAVLAIVLTAILVPVLLIKNATSTNSTQQSLALTTAYWTFDAVTTDYYGIYNGALIGSPIYFTQTNTQPFVAYGRGLYLLSASSQYFRVSSPTMDLSYRSFTLECWIYTIISSTTDYGIFGQCPSSTSTNQCLYFLIRNYKLYVGFTNNDLTGSTTLTTTTWYHIAFVYNYDTKQQILYINGVQDAIKSSADAYQGVGSTMYVGAAQVYLVLSYFNGYIDNFKITTRAKSSTELLTAATFIAYYSFDLPNPSYDNGPNGLNGTINNAVTVTGRVNQALRFTGSSSYFYAYGFYQMVWAVAYTKPYSVAFWINPTVASTCAILQIATSLGGSCYNLFGLYTNLGITAQTMVQGYYWSIMYGPVAPLSTWTHIAITFTTTNGLTLYQNGVWIGNTGIYTFASGGNGISYVQLGYYSGCSSNWIPNSAYQGSVDELYVYSREISQSEVTALANP